MWWGFQEDVRTQLHACIFRNKNPVEESWRTWIIWNCTHLPSTPQTLESNFQTDFVGRFLNEFVHSDDYDELIRWSTTDCDAEEASTLDDFGRYLVVRMKTVISPRGRTLNLKSALYKVSS